MFGTKKTIVDPNRALPGRDVKMPIPARHFVLDAPLDGELPGTERAMFALGCFWGAERKFYQQKGVVSTAVGYASGTTPNPTYKEVCSGMTGHAEVVRVIYDPKVVSYNDLLKLFWENHDPTQGMRQGNDEGTQYRSGIYAYTDAQLEQAKASSALYQEKLKAAGFGAITTEVIRTPEFYFAEEYHQQYLAKNPDGYCGIGGTGVACPIGLVQGS